MSRRSLVVAWCLGALAAGCATVALALVLGGGAPPKAPPGLSDRARLPAWIGDITSFVTLVIAVVAIGLGLLGSGALGPSRSDMRGSAAAVATLWLSLTILQIGLVSWELGGNADLFDSDRVRALAVQAALVLVALLLWTARGRAVAVAGTAVALLALLPVVLVGHPQSADHPIVAGASVSAHVVGVALWVGGLAALTWLAVIRDERWTGVLPAYSRLAFVSVIVLIGGGVVSATGRLNSPSDLLTSGYGAIVLLKVVLVAGLVGAGWLQRTYVVHRDRMLRRHFVAIASMELATMTIAMALAVALARTPPPT